MMDSRATEDRGTLLLPTGWVALILTLKDAQAGELLKALCLHCTGTVAEPKNVTSRGIYRLMILGGLHTDTIPSMGEQLPTRST